MSVVLLEIITTPSLNSGTELVSVELLGIISPSLNSSGGLVASVVGEVEDSTKDSVSSEGVGSEGERISSVELGEIVSGEVSDSDNANANCDEYGERLYGVKTTVLAKSKITPKENIFWNC